MLPHELVTVEIMLLGMGATLLSDLWALFLKSAFNFAPSNMGLLGRWLLHMPQGTFVHRSIAAASPRRGEVAVGWLAHYAVGVLYAFLFTVVVGTGWLQHPSILPAVGFGVVTIAAPFFIMQPAFGIGVASSRATNPWHARLRTLVIHVLFGLGLFVSALLVRWLT